MNNIQPKQTQQSQDQSLSKPFYLEVAIMKVMIIFVICLMSVSFLLIDYSYRYGGVQIASSNGTSDQSSGLDLDQINQQEDLNFDAGIESNGDISDVPPEKIDSLFDNLKI